MLLTQAKLTKGEVFWMGLIFWAVTFTALEAPYSFTFGTQIQSWQLWADIVVASIFTMDVIYQIRNFNKRERLHKSNLEQAKWWMALTIDIIGCIPFDLIAWHLGHNGYQMFSLIRIFRLSRIFRLFSLMNNVTIVPGIIKIQFLIAGALMAIHWISCGWVLIHPSTSIDTTSQYITALYWAVTTLTTIGYGDVIPTSNAGRLFTMVIMILGVGVYGLVIGNVSRMFAARDRYREKSREKLGDLAHFMKYYNIPLRVQDSVFTYYNHLMNKRLTDNDNRIISDLPHALQNELMTYMNMKLVRNVPLFKNCSQQCLKEVCSALEQKYLSPGQTIINTGELGNEMYIIGHGVVEVILKDGNTVASLHEGQFFGEAALLRETTRSANVRAQTYCDLYMLSKDDFMRIIRKHPDLLENMEKSTFKRSSDRRKAA